jgi:carbonic anhydrase/acetyltransferase-like protein (isoleucine patch superfamily)
MILLVSLVACGSETARENEKESGGAASRGNETPATTDEGSEQRIGRPATPVFGSSYISPLTEIFGEVFVGQKSFVASNSILRASPGQRVEIGSRSNAQDNVVVRAREGPVAVGEESSLSHHAIVRDSEIGNSVFVGYNAEARDSRVGDGAFIYHGALIDGVEIPENSFVGPGEEITDQAEADALPKVEDVGIDKYYDRKQTLENNLEFARAYIEFYESQGYGALLDVGPNPETFFSPEQVEPQIDETVELEEFARIVGDVQIAEDSSVGQRTTIRSDEGTPIFVGRGAIVGDRVTFHALRNTEIRIGEYLVAGDDSTLHGPLEMGSNNVVGDGAVVFRVRVGDGVQIGEGAVVAGPAGEGPTLEIPDGILIPSDAVVTSEEDLEALKN